VSLLNEGIYTSRNGIPEHQLQFFIGSSSQHKVFELRLTLRVDKGEIDRSGL
jgi:hypothetical protein